MGASSTNTTPSSVPSAPLIPFANRFQLLDELMREEETTQPNPRFRAQGVYKPPHMRTPFESVTSVNGSNELTNSTSTVRPGHGTSLCCEWKVASHPRTPRTNPTPPSASTASSFEEVKKKIQNEVLTLRETMKELKAMEDVFLEEETRLDHEFQAMKITGSTEEIGEVVASLVGRPSRPSPIKLSDIDVGIQYSIAERFCIVKRANSDSRPLLGQSSCRLISAAYRRLNGLRQPKKLHDRIR